MDAALNFGEPDKKLNLYKLLAELLTLRGKIDEAKIHIVLVYRIKEKRQWKIDTELLGLIEKYKISTENLPDEMELLKKLKTIWERLKLFNQELKKGIICKIISKGRAGFIETDDKKSYFFSAKEFKVKKELMKEGQKVTFFVQDSFDRKKNQPSKIAVYVKPVEE